MINDGKNFRLAKEKNYLLVEVLHLYISPRCSFPNFRALDADKKLAVFFVLFKGYIFHLNDSYHLWHSPINSF